MNSLKITLMRITFRINEDHVAIGERAKKHPQQRFRDVSEVPECPGITCQQRIKQNLKPVFHDFQKISEFPDFLKCVRNAMYRQI